MAQTKTDKKKKAKNEQKGSPKAAKKALDRADKAVRKARKAVARSSKKLRARADNLAQETQELSTEHAKAIRRSVTAAGAKDTQNPSPLPTPAPRPRTSVRKTGSARETRPSTPTLAELRTQAKEQKITGYYRMNKAALRAALTRPPA
ncbi:MAG: hypothetical protein MIJ73_06010 [Microbacterium aurum]|uniref:hypothetical protein n=1 Tax=Microbacterium TaxID=33882 RepID=UPI00248EA793|nr:hypothetical protein [Microbacterium aurum]